eukprot:2204380-Heterocapsa_arctica.AAC.1
MEKFIDMYTDCLNLLMDRTKVVLVLAAMTNNDYSAAAEATAELVKSSRIGQRLFALAWDVVAANTMHKIISVQLKQLNNEPLTEAKVSQMKKLCLAEVPTDKQQL